MSATFLARWSSVNGPFFSDLLMYQPLAPLLRLAAHNPLVRSLVIARFESARWLAPRRHRMPSACSFAFAASVRMIHRVHRNAAIVRLPSQPASFARLA